MDRTSQEQVITAHCEQLQKLTERIPGNFKEKDIHQWRVEYKRLRAFLRMITASVADHVPHITNELKRIYAVAGAIRDIQLFQNKLPVALNGHSDKLAVYESMLSRQLFSAKEAFIKRTDIFSFDREKARWLIMPPDYLNVDIVRKFVQQRVTAIRLILLTPDHDEAFHSLRKHLKDIQYAIRVFTDTWGISFPVTAWKNDKKLVDVAEQLGKYNDCCNALEHVSDEVIGELPLEEKNILMGLRETWIADKAQQRNELVPILDSLRLMPAVKTV